ncbi:sodium/proton antiporter 1-like isoform X1 [Musa acuminata AAA Group]|uniref:sodium/proton antiporter 1-like isoform X1 n=1 Tax=Musa acuminata AAA Group TaxID=214697 RepID=UPI0031E2A845
MASSSFLIGNGSLLTQSLVKLRNLNSSDSTAAAVSSSAAVFAALPRRPLLLGSSLGSQRWRRASGIARAEDKAKGSSSSSSSSPCSPLLPGKDRGDYRELIDGSGNCDPLCSVDEVSSQDFEASYQPKTDLLKALTILATALAGAAAINHSWVAANQDLALVLVFAIGYAGIVFEESLAFNKSGVGLLMAVCLWVIRSIGAPSTEIAVSELTHASAEVSEIVFFLLGAMTIVEIIDAHQGFKLVTDNITTRKPRILLWVVGLVTFFLSSVLDNLTSTIVMVSLLRKLVPPSEYRNLEAAGVLRELANYLDAHIPSVELIASAIGVVSAIIDNVPLVAATMGMYNLTSFPQDSEFWQLVAFCAGTGGSMLIIGSASGVAFMGMEKVDFFWYLRKVSGFAFAGYTAGIVAYVVVHNLPFSLPTSLAELPFLSGP